jgi:hypothetical protein
MSSNFCYVMPKNSLSKDVRINTLVSQIIQKIGDIPNHHEYRGNMELLKMVCTIIEHEVDNKKAKVKINKKDVVFQVYGRIWSGLSPETLKALDANIEYLWENGQIKRKSIFRIAAAKVCDWFERRIL